MRLLLVAVVLLHSQLAKSDEIEIVLYPAFAGREAARANVVAGRVIESGERRESTMEDTSAANLRRNLDLMVNDEIDEHPVDVLVGARTYRTTTDAEGYFVVELDDLRSVQDGWSSFQASSEGATARGALLILPAANAHGVISDLDDTILITEVNDKRRMLANTLFGNPLQRLAVPGAAKLYRRLAERNPKPDAAPIFYLSASPRQLHTSIQKFLDHNEFPRGVLITKRVTNDASSEPWTNQMAYKIARIEDILARTPNVRYTLIGDDGERDPEIYAEIRRRSPERIEAIWIRRVNPDPLRARLPDQGDLSELLTEN